MQKAAWLRHRRKSWVLVLFTAGISGACERPMGAERAYRARVLPTIVREPANDRVMGPLSRLAQHVVAGLQDPAVRGRVVRAMKDPSTMGRGIDLLDCDAGPVEATLASAERRGGRNRVAFCAEMRRSDGLILYMDPDRLAGWDSTVIPIVTAIANPSEGVPNSFRGYRSPSEMIDLPSDGSLAGPILVILPYLHHGRSASRQPRLLPSEIIQVAPPPPDTASSH